MSSTTPISSSNFIYPIDKLFPKERYGKDKKEILHFLIAYRQPVEKIKEWISKIKNDPANLLNYQSEVMKLTPLAVCAMVKDQTTAALLLQEGGDPTIGDLKGWTPFHHAAVVDDKEMLQLLKTATKVDQVMIENLRNEKGGNYQDLQELLKRQLPRSDDQVFFYQDEKGNIVPGAMKDFIKLTGALYCKNVLIKPSVLIHQWFQIKTHQKSRQDLEEFLQKKYNECLLNPPKMYLRKDSTSDPGDYDVYTDQDLKFFQGITIYGGELNNSPTNTTYLLGNIDGRKIRNEGSMIRDGFPNCAHFAVDHGGSTPHFFVANRAIKKGEKLVWNHGGDPKVKLESIHPELNPTDLEEYIKKINLIDELTSLAEFFSSSPGFNLKAFLNNCIAREKLSYLLETPTSVLYLLSKGLLPCQDLCTVLAHPRLKQACLSVDNLDARRDFAAKCYQIEEKLQEYLAKGKNQLVQEIRQLLGKWSGKQPTSLLVHTVSFFVKSLTENVNPLEDLSEFKVGIEEYTKFIRCLRDYCLENRGTETIVKTMKDRFEVLSLKKKQRALEDVGFFAETVREKKESLDRILKALKSTLGK